MDKNRGDKPEQKDEAPEGIAASILQSLGGMMPALDELLKGMKQSAAFREKLQAIDTEIEARWRSQPLKRTEGGLLSFQSSLSRGSRPRIIPPAKRQAASRVKREVVASKEPSVDVLDEGTHLRLLAELPGVEEQDIKVNLNDNRLVLSTDTPTHKYFKEITLPGTPRGQMNKSYRNGVLELILPKE